MLCAPPRRSRTGRPGFVVWPAVQSTSRVSWFQNAKAAPPAIKVVLGRTQSAPCRLRAQPLGHSRAVRSEAMVGAGRMPWLRPAGAGQALRRPSSARGARGRPYARRVLGRGERSAAARLRRALTQALRCLGGSLGRLQLGETYDHRPSPWLGVVNGTMPRSPNSLFWLPGQRAERADRAAKGADANLRVTARPQTERAGAAKQGLARPRPWGTLLWVNGPSVPSLPKACAQGGCRAKAGPRAPWPALPAACDKAILCPGSVPSAVPPRFWLRPAGAGASFGCWFPKCPKGTLRVAGMP